MTVDSPLRSPACLTPYARYPGPPVIRQIVPRLKAVQSSMTPSHAVIAGWVVMLILFLVSIGVCLTPKHDGFSQEIPLPGPTRLSQTGLTPDQLPLLVTSSNDAMGTVLETWLTGNDSTGYTVLDAKSYQRRTKNHTSHKKPLPAKIVHLNTATLAQLQTLPGVGPKMAMRILAYRKALGGQFTRIEQLLDVKGIGPKTFAKLARFCQL